MSKKDQASKKKRFDKIKYLSCYAKLEYIKLKQIFLKALLLDYFYLKYYI